MRELVTMFTARLILLLALTVAVADTAEAQPTAKVYQVGLLSNGGNLTTWRAQYAPFIEAMRELNYVEGRNLVIRPAFADGKVERLPILVADLVSAKVDVIVSSAAPRRWPQSELPPRSRLSCGSSTTLWAGDSSRASRDPAATSQG
jgi:hypothetical protein